MSDGTIPLREHFEALLNAQTRYTEQALRLSEIAVARADAANEKRLDALNEIRQMAEDERRLSMPRSEAEIRLTELARSVSELRAIVMSGRDKGTGMHAGWAVAMGAVAVVVSIVSAIVALTR